MTCSLFQVSWTSFSCRQVQCEWPETEMRKIPRSKHLHWQRCQAILHGCYDFRCQFHQHFTHGFFYESFARSLFLYSHLRFELLAQEYWRKWGRKMLVKLTTSFSLSSTLNESLCSSTFPKERPFFELVHVITNFDLRQAKIWLKASVWYS